MYKLYTWPASGSPTEMVGVYEIGLYRCGTVREIHPLHRKRCMFPQYSISEKQIYTETKRGGLRQDRPELIGVISVISHKPPVPKLDYI